MSGCSLAASDVSVKKRKRNSDSDVNKVIVAAAQSIGKLSNSVMESQMKKDKDDDLDSDWMFLKAMYADLKTVPIGRERDLLKMRIHTEILNAKYGAQSTQSAGASYTPGTPIQNQMPVRPLYIYRRSNLQPAGDSASTFLNINDSQA